VVAIGVGAQVDIEEQFKNLSVTAISINPVTTESTQSKLSEADVSYIREHATLVSAVTAMYQGKLPVVAGGDESQLTILGRDDGFVPVTNLTVVAGRYFTEEELAGRDRVVVLGATAVDDLFAGDAVAAVGETVSIARKSFTVVGIFEDSGAAIGPVGFDDSVYLPYDTATRSVLGASGVVRLAANATDIDHITPAMDELTTVLRDAHKLRPADSDDFRLKDQGSKVTSAQESADTMATLLTIVAAVVLVVSGIGIMNVMLVTVTERTREIGIMKAVGAESQTILWQFLLESSVLSIVGGLIGIVLAEAALPLLSTTSGLTMVPSAGGVILGFAFSVLTGIVFGLYPAYTAAQLDPVDALRAE